MSGQIGQIVGFLWTVAAIFFLISFFVGPVLFAYWRAREKADAAATKEVMDSLKSDTTNAYIWDA
jgi:cbb3-type cytochrome oxidase subunit 3